MCIRDRGRVQRVRTYVCVCVCVCVCGNGIQGGDGDSVLVSFPNKTLVTLPVLFSWTRYSVLFLEDDANYRSITPVGFITCGLVTV